VTASGAGLAVLLAALVPGLGHVALGEARRGAGLFLVVAVTFATGLALHGTLPRFDSGQPLSSLAAATTSATGVLALGARLAGAAVGEPRPPSPWTGYGRTFLLTAGVMNLLLVVDTLARSLDRRQRERR